MRPEGRSERLPEALPKGRHLALPDALRPDWAAPAGICALMSTRQGGVSAPPCDSLDLRLPAPGSEAATGAATLQENRRRFAEALDAAPVYLEQVHGADVVRLERDALQGSPGRLRADASITTVPGLACAVLVADCLPVLFCSDDGLAVGAAHAGWRGLAAGVLDNTVAALCDLAGVAPGRLIAWLGPCIGPRQFEVGADVLRAFGADPGLSGGRHFVARPRADGSPRWLGDLALLATDRLRAAGVTRVSAAAQCTVEDRSRFFSFRRDGVTGRMAAAVCIRGAG